MLKRTTYLASALALVISLAVGEAMANNTMGAVINNHGIVTQGQVGNNTIIVQGPPPATIRVVENLPVKDNGDGTYVFSEVIEIVAQSPPNNLFVALKKNSDIARRAGPISTALEVTPTFGGISMMKIGETADVFWTLLQTPTGRYTIRVRCNSMQAKPAVGVELNVR